MNAPAGQNVQPGTPLLEVQNLSVGFGGQPVVQGLNLTLRAGEKLALVGESGSGKTVSALSLLKLVPQAEVTGTALLNGRDLLQLSERELRGVRGDEVACIFQEPMTALNPLYTIGNQIAEVLTFKKGLPPREAHQRVLELLTATGIPEPERRANAFPHQLSGGQRQRAMIAMALASEPKLLIADEPTTALDASLRVQMLDLLDALQVRLGMAVLIITHDLHLVKRFAHRIAVMEKGLLVEQGPVADVFARPQHPYTQKLLNSRPQRPADLDRVAPEGAAPMSAQALKVAYPVPLPGLKGWFRKGRFEAVRGIDFSVPAGRTLGVVGESGSGKSTLALAALGLVPLEGTLQVMGQSWAAVQGQKHALRALRQQVQVVFQDPFSSLSPRFSIEQIVGEGLRIHHPQASEMERRDRVLAALKEVGLLGGLTEEQQLAWLQRYPHEFSGGQRQRIAIARALIVEPRMLVLDEPTSALDVTVQKQVIELLLQLQRQRGLSYLLITHDVDVIWAMAHEVMVMREGRVVEAGTTERVLKQPEHPYTQALVGSAAAL